MQRGQGAKAKQKTLSSGDRMCAPAHDRTNAGDRMCAQRSVRDYLGPVFNVANPAVVARVLSAADNNKSSEGAPYNINETTRDKYDRGAGSSGFYTLPQEEQTRLQNELYKARGEWEAETRKFRTEKTKQVIFLVFVGRVHVYGVGTTSVTSTSNGRDHSPNRTPVFGQSCIDSHVQQIL